MPPPTSTTPPPGLPRGLAAWACLVAAACAPAAAGSGPGSAPADGSADTRADTAGASHAEADVAFMQGMIHHHAQAVAMARLVPDRAESPALRRLAARVLNSQKTEIGVMADWLRARDEPVPELAAAAVEAAEEDADGAAGEDGDRDGPPGGLAPPGGWDAGPQMPGLLSDARMERLEEARGAAFDRLFLTLMIDHHDGAVVMVDRLVRTPDGAREESVFRLASGIRADQSTEIDRMRTMLRESLFGTDSPR